MPAAPFMDIASHPAAWTPEPVENARLAAFDDPEEWTAFSQSRPASGGSNTVWESRVAVQGMHCAACSLAVERALMAVDGVLSAQVSAASGRAIVVWSAARTSPSAWMGAPLAAGYSVLPASDAFSASSSSATRQQSRLALWRWLVAGFCMMQVMMYAYPAYIAGPGDITPDIEKLLRWASWVLTLPVILFSCGPFFGNALRDLRHRSISMDLPVAIGIAVTFAASTAATFDPAGRWGGEVYFDSLTMFVFFLLTGRWLEHRLREKTAGSLDNLMQRLPQSVERQRLDGSFERVAVRRLQVSDLVRVLPGEAFPADGVIEQGDTLADEALLTGESRPVPRPCGSRVLAASHNLSAAVQVRIDQLGADTQYAQIVALMERASADKPRLALLADRIAKPFLWFVLLSAAGAAAFWWQTDPAKALMAAVAVLIVTCPCALSLATPTAMLTTAGLLSRNGVLVRRLQALEALAEIDTVIFDKTGTLTEARMGLRRVLAREGVTQNDALQMAAALARHSLHPVSRALVAAADERFATSASASMQWADVIERPGLGLESATGSIRFGSARFCGLDMQRQMQRPGCLQVFLADSKGWLARFELDEVGRPDAREAVVALREAGLSVEMLSGDRAAAALAVSVSLGIEHVRGDCTPAAKLEHLRDLQKQGRKVWMIGDGLNDAPVLAGAHVSVAIGSAVPLAQAQSDFVMPGAQLMMLPNLLLQARRTMRIVRQNLWWAAIYNAVCVPMALAGWLPAWLAGLGMALSSLLVIANAARLSRTGPVQANGAWSV
ncbi:MAG: cation-translocating P-type ATPase [Comamonadaceae bacterium]|nr:MAG: cation-translocating P-type ATPase [Comamonadaceae bacterium]